MTTFVYKAKKNAAETVTGKINAHSKEEAVDLINQLGFLPVSIAPEVQDTTSVKGQPKVINRKIKHKELYMFSRQLANLLKSGVSLIRALGIMEEQTQNIKFKNIIQSIVYDVKNGNSFSESLTKYPTVFSSLYVVLVKAGEESGNLQTMLVSISIYQRKQEAIMSKVRTAIAYPILMLIVGAATIYFVLTFVLPKMSSLFNSIGDALPLPTVILLNVSSILSQWWAVVLIATLGVYILARNWARSKMGKYAYSRMVLKVPIFGEIILKTELARFSRTLVLLHKGGVSIIRALDISIPILSNELIKGYLLICKDELIGGGSFGNSLKKIKEIPPMMGHLVAIGEESGNLDDVLEEIADNYEEETNERIKILTTLLEPLMILVVGLVIGFIVFAMLLPIFQIDVLAR